MSSPLPQPDPDWKRNPQSYLLLWVFSMALIPAVFLIRPVIDVIMSIPYEQIMPWAAATLIALMAIIIGAHWWWRYRQTGGRRYRPTTRQWQEPASRARAAPTEVIRFKDINSGRHVMSLTLEQLQRVLFISGRPGSGKTTILRAIALAAMRAAASSPGAVIHTITFDANRSLAEFVACASLRHGREPVVIELGAGDYLTPYQFPRRGPGGDEAAAEAIRRAWFSFEREIPAQLRDAIVHDFRLLAASGFGFDQAIRVLLSDSFRDEAMRLGRSYLSHHTGEWLALIANMPRSEWYHKFSSTLARLFQLLENTPARLALSGGGHFSFDVVNDRLYRGRGLDIIVTATGQMDEELIYFVFGILFSDLASILRARLQSPADGRWPEIVILADEVGRYGGAEAILDLVSAGRNVDVKAALATHSLMSLRPELRAMIPVLAVNRIAGAEIGEGAALTAQQLVRYNPGLVKTLGPDGKPASYWSAEDQSREFQSWLQHAQDHEFAVRLAGQEKTLRGRAAPDPELFPSPAVLGAGLRQAARQSGRPVAEVLAELDRINRDLDARFGPVDYRVESEPSDVDGSDWRERPDDDFAPHI